MSVRDQLARLPAKSLADQVADQLRTAIQQGRYAPGTRLVERRLAGELGVSHIPVREALARLVEEGLVQHLPRRGARVAALGARDLEEVSSVRTVLEELVAVRAQERMTPPLARELRQLVERMRTAAERGDVRRVFELDQLLHARLWEAADHRLLNDIAAQLRGRIDMFLRTATAALEADQLVEHAAAHGVLIDAITRGSANKARAAMRDHIATAANRLRQLPSQEDEGQIVSAPN